MVTKMKSWINRTNKKSAAFDFQFRYNVRDAIGVTERLLHLPNWTKLKVTTILCTMQLIVVMQFTFVENHDTQYRSADSQNDPLKEILLQQMHICLPCRELLVSSSHTGEITNLS